MERILVIDDDPLLCDLVVETLKGSYEIMTAQDGTRGIAAAISHHPDLIICDISMPDIDGYTVYQRLQEYETLIDVPFIFLSAFSDQDTVRQGMGLGVDDFLAKPFCAEELRRIIRVRLEKRTRQRDTVLQAIEQLRINITAALPHELRTAITIIEGYTYLALEDTDKMSTIEREIVETIHKSAVRLHDMAEKYEWYLKTHTFTWCIQKAISHPDTIIRQVVYPLAQRFDRLGDLKMCLTPARVNIKDEYLAKIVEELVENAFKFSASGSPVTVTGVQKDAKTYNIAITNEGREMSREQIAHVGGFMQFDREIYEQQGTGLGLIIAKRLAELCEGHLAIQSANRQTRVSVTLPCYIPKREAAEDGTWQKS